MNNKTNKIKMATLFNMLNTSSSNDIENYIYINKLDINYKNEKISNSLLTAINTSLINGVHVKQNKENALFILNNINEPFYKNIRDNLDIIELFILNQNAISSNDFIENTIQQIIQNKYKDRESLDIILLDTIQKLISIDNLKKPTIRNSILNFFSRNNNYNVYNLSPKILNKIKEEEEANDVQSIQFSQLNEKGLNIHKCSEKLIETIFIYSKKYNDKSLLSFILTFLDDEIKIKTNFKPYLFKNLLILSSYKTKNNSNDKIIIAEIFKKIDFEKYPLSYSDIDEESKNIVNKIAKNSPELYSEIDSYFLRSRIFITKRDKTPCIKKENNKLSKIRL